VNTDGSFTLTQVVALAGLLQCFAILAYVSLRTVSLRRAALVLLFFALLGIGLLGRSLPAELGSGPQVGLVLPILIWTADVLIPPLSVLLIGQVALERRPVGWELMLPLLPLLAFLAVLGISAGSGVCLPEEAWLCRETLDLLRLAAVVLGAACLLLLWLRRGWLRGLMLQDNGRERYVLAVTLAAVNLLVLAVDLADVMGLLQHGQADLLRSALPMAFAYLAATLMFRLYPQPVPMKADPARPRVEVELREEERRLAASIDKLMREDKLYQEQSFSRADLARELQVSENQVSRVVNAAFGKSFPQLVNYHRVEEAKYLLERSEMPITEIAFEVGFNSLPSFNRAFKEHAGTTPRDWRDRQAAARREESSGEG